MDHYQELINLAGAGMMAGIGWWCRKIWESIDRLQQEVHAIEVDLPRNYVRQDQIDAKLDKIDSRFDKLDAHITKLFERLEHKGM